MSYVSVDSTEIFNTCLDKFRMSSEAYACFCLQLKFVDISRKLCTTVVGTDDDVKLDEPGGICVEEGSGVAYIADTNNHIIRILNLKDRTFSQVQL